MIEEIDELIDYLKSLADRMDSIGDAADVSMALMYVNHARKRVSNREKGLED